MRARALTYSCAQSYFNLQLQTAKHLPATAISLERLQPSKLTGAASNLTTQV